MIMCNNEINTVKRSIQIPLAPLNSKKQLSRQIVELICLKNSLWVDSGKIHTLRNLAVLSMLITGFAFGNDEKFRSLSTEMT